MYQHLVLSIYIYIGTLVLSFINTYIRKHNMDTARLKRKYARTVFYQIIFYILGFIFLITIFPLGLLFIMMAFLNGMRARRIRRQIK